MNTKAELNVAHKLISLTELKKGTSIAYNNAGLAKATGVSTTGTTWHFCVPTYGTASFKVGEDRFYVEDEHLAGRAMAAIKKLLEHEEAQRAAFRDKKLEKFIEQL